MIETIVGSLLDCNAQYIAHQTNCTSRGAAGLARALFKMHPYADTYCTRAQNSEPGTIHISGDGKSQRLVINMYAQYYPGAAKISGNIDTAEARLCYFKSCLESISSIEDIKCIAFPYGIGCGLAGGSWSTYYEILSEFANRAESADVKVLLIKQPDIKVSPR